MWVERVHCTDADSAPLININHSEILKTHSKVLKQVVNFYNFQNSPLHFTN